jgi:hypothetical protein
MGEALSYSITKTNVFGFLVFILSLQPEWSIHDTAVFDQVLCVGHFKPWYMLPFHLYHICSFNHTIHPYCEHSAITSPNCTKINLVVQTQ